MGFIDLVEADTLLQWKKKNMRNSEPDIYINSSALYLKFIILRNSSHAWNPHWHSYLFEKNLYSI